jgi:hypothetical protein
MLEFSNRGELEQWLRDFVEKNPGKGLTLEGTVNSKRTTVVLGNEVNIKTEVVKEVQQVEVQRLKIDLGEVKTV